MTELTSTDQCDLLLFTWNEITSPGSPHQTAIRLCLFFATITFIVSTLASNYSQVDKLWSILPVIYVWIWVCDARTLLMGAVVTLWGIRLTYNFHRRGGYTWPPWQGDEDYRWKTLQSGKYIPFLNSQWAWNLLNLVFISIYQNILLMLLSCPAAVAYAAAHLPRDCVHGVYSSLNFQDLVIATIILLLILVESIADNQQHAFQTTKHRLRSKGESLKGEYADGFCQSGLFQFLRKPNYAAEQCIWITFYFFSVSACHQWLNWSITGSALLIALFQGSGHLTETISQSKYPNYEAYMRRVPLYFPNPFHGRGRCQAKDNWYECLEHDSCCVWKLGSRLRIDANVSLKKQRRRTDLTLFDISLRLFVGRGLISSSKHIDPTFSSCI